MVEIWLNVESHVYLSSGDSLPTLCDRIITAFDEEPLPTTPPVRYRLRTMTPVGGEKQSLEQDDLATAWARATQNPLSHLWATSRIFARNPYILQPEITEAYGMSLNIRQVVNQVEVYAVRLAFQDSTEWFMPGGALWEPEYSFVQDYLTQGYTLNPSTPPLEGLFVPDDRLSQGNRQKVLTWIGRYMRIAQPNWLVATYESPLKFDPTTNRLFYDIHSELEERALHAPLVYYLGPGISFPELSRFQDAYFPVVVDGMTLQVREDHFGFVREQAEPLML